MKFVYADLELPATAIESQPIVSKHTGKELRKLEVHIRIQGEATEEAVDNAMQDINGKLATVQNDDGSDLGKWVVNQRSYSYESGVPVYNHVLDLVEWENLSPEVIRIGDSIELAPYYYEELIDQEAIVITARFRISCDQQDEVFKIGEKSRYFPVVRVGVAEETLSMRIGKCIWSYDEDGGVKQELILVQDVYDDPGHRPFLGLFEPELIRIEDYLIKQSNVLAELVKLLHDNGVLGDERTNDLCSRCDEFGGLRLRDFWRVDDLDEWRK